MRGAPVFQSFGFFHPPQDTLEKTIETLKSLPDVFTHHSTLIVRQNIHYEKNLRKGLHILKEKIYGESKLFFYQRSTDGI